MYKINVLPRAFRNDPFPCNILLALSRTLHKVKSKILSQVFKAPGLYLGPGSVIRSAKHISFGSNVYAARNLWLEAVCTYRDQQFRPQIDIGDNVAFSDGVHITSIERITIKRNVLMGSRVYISDHNHGVYNGFTQSRPDEPPTHRCLGGGGQVLIGENVWIGDNVIIVGPVEIGDAAIIGANSVVKRNIPSGAIAAGIPAEIVKRFDALTGRWERV